MSSPSSVLTPRKLGGILDKDWHGKLAKLTQLALQTIVQSGHIRNKWLTLESLHKLVTAHYSFDNIGGLTEKQLTKALDTIYPHIESRDAAIAK
jgi:hypothetical protein